MCDMFTVNKHNCSLYNVATVDDMMFIGPYRRGSSSFINVKLLEIFGLEYFTKY